MTDALVRDLFDGPLDIVGDVHGEIDALRNLLHQLGYSDDGLHPEKRRLVFVGDLADRGPDSPGVVALVQNLVESGAAQCVLGNHDLNILLGDRKHDNHWFFGEKFALDAADEPTPAVIADETIRDRVNQFFRTLPLALERDDLRVIHACWDDEMIEVARRSTDAVALHQEHAERITTNNRI
jgi:predicted MPP superfamily phosphohydrolase